MKAPFRRIERDDEQRHRKWKALAGGLFVAAMGTALALGPLVPSRPPLVLLVLGVTSAISGTVVGWLVRERKGSMGGMVSQLFAFPLGAFLIGFRPWSVSWPQSAGLDWIVFLFVAVPCAAAGGALGSRYASSGRGWARLALSAAAGGVVILAIGSRLIVETKLRTFEVASKPSLLRTVDREFIAQANRWNWQVHWEKGIWQGDYLVLRTFAEGWRSMMICSDTAAPRLVLLWAARNGTQALSPPDSEAVARRRLRAMGLRESLLVRPRLFDGYWRFGREASPWTFIAANGQAEIRYDSRSPATVPCTRSVVAAAPLP